MPLWGKDIGLIQFNLEISENGEIVSELKPEVVVELCTYNVNQAWWTFVNDIDYMKSILANDPTQKAIILHDLKAAKKYGAKNIFKPIVMAHELEYLTDYEKAFNEFSPSLNEKIKEYKMDCIHYKNPENWAQVEADLQFLNFIVELFSDVMKEYKNNYGLETLEIMENDVQNRKSVQEEVKKFMEELI